jgi:phage repressor protein C with HTH and peptisase S24 domain
MNRKDSPSADGSQRASENRTTHNQSVNTDVERQGGGAAQPRVEPQLPHDIDESVHSQARASARQAEVGEQAYEDTLSPSQDTDRGPVLDGLYKGAVAPDRGKGPPRQ